MFLSAGCTGYNLGTNDKTSKALHSTTQLSLMAQCCWYSNWHHSFTYIFLKCLVSDTCHACQVAYGLLQTNIQTFSPQTSFKLKCYLTEPWLLFLKRGGGGGLKVSSIQTQNKALNPLAQWSRLSRWPPQVIQTEEDCTQSTWLISG